MIPLIGGSAIGCERASGTAPLFNLSYSPFSKNESHLARYWPHVPNLYLDKMLENIHIGGNQDIDFINSVCPCAGLSMLNVSKARGSDAVQNEWMLKSAEFTLSVIRPKVLWGENAPGLFDSALSLVEKMKEIGAKHGYSFSMVKTNTELHGLPQRRVRTFYFFWNTPTVPILEWKLRKSKKLGEYLSDIPKNATLQDMFIHHGKVSERFLPYKFILMREGLTHKEFTEKIGRGTIYKYLEQHHLIEECLNWLKLHHPTEMFYGNRTFVAQLEHLKNKLSRGLGYWDDSPKFMGTYFTAVISKNIEFAVHPSEDRFFNVRELLHLMGMPHDFEIDSVKNVNHICQNVPVNTAHDWAVEVVKFCRGQATMSDFSFLKQDNIAQTFVDSFPPSDILKSNKRKIKAPTSPRSKRLKKKDAKYELKTELKEIKEDLHSMKESVDQLTQLTFNRLKDENKLKKIQDFCEKKIKQEQETLKTSGQYIKVEEKFIPKVEKREIDDDIVILGQEKVEYKCGACDMRAISERQIKLHWDQGCEAIKSL